MPTIDLTGRVSFYASMRHYIDHLWPIIEAMPPEHVDGLYTLPSLHSYAESRLDPTLVKKRTLPPKVPFVVASFRDLQKVGEQRAVCFVEHGVGQTYGDGSPSNPGGRSRQGIKLFLCPNPRVADLNAEAHPRAVVEIVGSPRLDALQRVWRARSQERPQDGSEGNLEASGGKPGTVLALTWHWNNAQAPESRWAFPYYERTFPNLADRFEVLAHAHPRVWDRIEDRFIRAGFKPTPYFEDLLGADLMALDNSSAGPEWAAITDKPLLWLNAPWYRRTARHGMRFWDWTEGQVEIGKPDDLWSGIERALDDPPEAREARARMVEQTFPIRDGRASERSAALIVKHLVE